MNETDVVWQEVQSNWTILDTRMQREKTGHTRTMLLARCTCGDTRWRAAGNIRSGRSMQCRGCAARTHGGSKEREYAAWYAMLHRCTAPESQFFARYGGRGITVCASWYAYPVFLQEMGRCPPGMTLEREDNDGPYCKNNCVWASRREQAANKSNNRRITAFGRTQHLAAWVAEFKIPYDRTWRRLHAGWSPERAFTQEVQHGH